MSTVTVTFSPVPNAPPALQWAEIRIHFTTEPDDFEQFTAALARLEHIIRVTGFLDPTGIVTWDFLISKPTPVTEEERRRKIQAIKDYLIRNREYHFGANSELRFEGK